MRIISIFGGSGFIGSELVSELAKNEFEIRLFTRNKIKANHLKIIPSRLHTQCIPGSSQSHFWQKMKNKLTG